jgi:hypothetical protein
MSNLETRLRETFEQVAESTKVTRRINEIVQVRRSRAVPGFAVGLAAFTFVVAVFAPLVLGGPLASEVAGSPSAPDVAFDPAWLTVEPEDIDAFNRIPLPGNAPRASLRSEKIWCFYEDARPLETHVTSVEVDEPVTPEALTSTCATAAESATGLESPPQAFTICRGVFDSPAYHEWITAAEHTVISGDVAGPKPGFPVILGWQSDCISERLDTSPNTVTLTTDLSIDAINRARQLELAVIGAASQTCLSHDQSEALAAAVVDKLGQDWLHTVLRSIPTTAGPCFQPSIDQQWGWVISHLIRDDHAGQTDSTIGPTDP